MKHRFSIFKNRSRGGIYYLKDRQTEARVSLNTKDQARANELLASYNEAAREWLNGLRRQLKRSGTEG